MCELLIKNADIISMDDQLNRYEWVLIKNGMIDKVGKGTPPSGAGRVMDVCGNVILPGLTDCHVHVINSGVTFGGVALEDCKNIDEVLVRLKERCVSEGDSDSWIYGVNYVPQNVAEARYPTRWELDAICGNHKIIIFAATLHGCAVSSNAMDIAAVPEDYPGVEKIDGAVAGIYASDESSFLATSNVLGSLTDDELWEFVKQCETYAKARGVTSIHGLFGQFVKDDRDLDLILERKDDLDIDVTVFYQTWDVRKVLDKGLPRVGGCLTLDGALFEYTMANFEPFVTVPALRGVLYHNDEEVYRVISDAHKAGIQCTMHAVGERAIDQLIYSYYRVIMEQGKKDLRHRIEHFCLPTESQIQMAKDLDLILSMQPGFTYLWDKEQGGEFEMILGRERADRWDPFHKIIDKGITICGGSDCPVTLIEPLVDIAACVKGNNPKRNISVTEAIKMYTVNASYAEHAEKWKGSIEPGKYADLVMVDRDPYKCADSKSIYNIKVVKTIKRGKVIYENKNFEV